MTVGLWSALMLLYLLLALAVLWWGWTLPPKEPEGQVIQGEDHAEVVRRMRLLQGGRK